MLLSLINFSANNMNQYWLIEWHLENTMTQFYMSLNCNEFFTHWWIFYGNVLIVISLKIEWILVVWMVTVYISFCNYCHRRWHLSINVFFTVLWFSWCNVDMFVIQIIFYLSAINHSIVYCQLSTIDVFADCIGGPRGGPWEPAPLLLQNFCWLFNI